MGHDISPIGNHNLNTANLKVLAEDLSARLDINIEYGYVGIEPFFKLLGQDLAEGIIIIGAIIKDETFQTFRLYDNNYHVMRSVSVLSYCYNTMCNMGI